MVVALSSPSVYCRTAACFAVTGAAESADSLCALRCAGIVAALLGVVGASPSTLPSCTLGDNPARLSQSLASFKTKAEAPVELPANDPALYACHALVILMDTEPTVAHEVVATFKSGAALANCLRLYTGEMREVVAQTLARTFANLNYEPGSGNERHQQAFCKALIAEGLPSLLPSLVRPELPALSDEMLTSLNEILEVLGYDCLPRASAGAVATAVMRYIEDGTLETARGKATAAFGRLMEGGSVSAILEERLPGKLIQNVARVMVTGTSTEARMGLMIVMHQQAWHHASGAVLGPAVAGGFVPGCFRVVRESPQPFFSRTTPMPRVEFLVREFLQHIAMSGEERAVVQSINLGALPLLRALFEMPEEREVALNICCGFLRFPTATAKMREDGIIPGLLLEVAHEGDPDFLRAFGGFLIKTADTLGLPYLTCEFLSAGVVDKLKQARSRATQPQVRRLLQQAAEVLEFYEKIGPAGIEAYLRLPE